MMKTPLNIFLMYGLVGLAIAGGVVTVSEVTSRVVPVFPKDGRLNIDLILSTSTVDQSTTYAGYSPMSGNPHTGDNYTLRVTADSVMVYRSGTLSLTSGWTTIQGASRGITLQTGVKTRLGSVTLPAGNITLVRVKLVDVTVQRSSDGVLEDVGMQSSQMDIPAHAMVRAQTTTDVLVDFHLACPATPFGSTSDASGHGRCSIVSSTEEED